MLGVPTIQFTQEQARTLTGVSAEMIRHWRKTVPYLAGKLGKVSRFTLSDVIGLAATHDLISTFGVHIANISEGVDALFHLLAEAQPTTLAQMVACVTTADAALLPAAEFTCKRLGGPVLVLPLEPVISRLRRHLLPIVSDVEQAALPFPPLMIRTKT